VGSSKGTNSGTIWRAIRDWEYTHFGNAGTSMANGLKTNTQIGKSITEEEGSSSYKTL
jgi:hypothetical protein